MHEPVLACRCGCTDPARLTRLGESVTEVLEKIPARLKVIRHVRPRYACRACEAMLQAPAPALPIERGRPGPGLVAHVLVSKYLDGLPLFRLSGILAREGVEIERQTLADWVGHGAWWLRPLAEAIGTYALAQGVIWTDDTTIRVLAPGRGRTRIGRFWVYAFDPRPWGGTGPPAAFYCYSPDRKGERPREHLAGYAGWLHADAYAGYDALTAAKGGKPSAITHVACMAHARRELFKVYDSTKSPIAEEALRRIGELYAIEAAINGQSPEQRRAARQAQSKPLLDALHAWMLQQRRRLSGKSTLGKALQYALNRWDALARYIEDGRLSIDNNLAERQLRGIAVTRKNYPVRRQRCRRAARRDHLHHRGNREAERPRSGSLHRRRARSPRTRPSHHPHRRTAALELPGRASTRRNGLTLTACGGWCQHPPTVGARPPPGPAAMLPADRHAGIGAGWRRHGQGDEAAPEGPPVPGRVGKSRLRLLALTFSLSGRTFGGLTAVTGGSPTLTRQTTKKLLAGNNVRGQVTSSARARNRYHSCEPPVGPERRARCS